jgi:hypothetical protein
MKVAQAFDNQIDPLEEQFLGIHAKTAPRLAACS